MKKLFTIIITLLLFTGCVKTQKPLPLPEIEGGQRGELGIDKNINEKTLDEYLGRDDIVYRDLRMLVDVANYEAIGGNSNLTGFVEGFEVVPYPYLCNPEGLPENIGEGYKGNALFSKIDGEYVANYEQSISIIEELFPKDKIIFLMCGGGGYAGMGKDLLVSLGYDENKIYNVGGYWYYDGNHNINITKEAGDITYYDFELVNYHDIDFEQLSPINGYIPKEDIQETSDDEYEVINVDKFNEKLQNKETFITCVYLSGCVTCANFTPLVEKFVKENDDLDFYWMNYADFEKEEKLVEYAPSVIVVVDGEVVDSLDPNSDTDAPIYKTTKDLSLWVNQYINVNIVETDDVNEKQDCEDACVISEE